MTVFVLISYIAGKAYVRGTCLTETYASNWVAEAPDVREAIATTPRDKEN